MREIFVFGSNLAGKHHGGSARSAVEKHGAVMGNGIGMQGESYAIPTLDENFGKLYLCEIKNYVDDFLAFARNHPELRFNIVAIGCGIAEFTPEQIAPMFKYATANCELPLEFTSITPQHRTADEIDGGDNFGG